MKCIRYNRKGFTLSECILSLMVIGIILAAAATLAFAMNSAEKVTDDMGESQAYIRYATMRVSELIRNSNMVFATSYLHNGIAIWTDVNNSGRIGACELVYVEYDAANDEIDIVEFSEYNVVVTVGQVENGNARLLSEQNETGRYTNVVFDCTKASFPVSNPVGDLVSILLTVDENDVSKQYQISARRMVSMDYLLNVSGGLKGGDDDL
ncbi:MAG: prepilin-type N-terminal cleavage/methylation domain-containing protein [Planctomycetes bacterium]|nr:prepilin-type N-terminal cleavage/methylation domain-containing protein [Planctomycetota bacterium]